MSSGIVLSEVTADGPGEYTYREDCKLVRCPWHGWEFEIASGRMLADPQVRARRYPVRVADNGDLVLIARPSKYLHAVGERICI